MGVFVTSSLPGRTLMPREAGDEPRYLSPDGACQLRDFVSLDFPRVTAERAHCWRNVWLKVQPCPSACWALGSRDKEPLWLTVPFLSLPLGSGSLSTPNFCWPTTPNPCCMACHTSFYFILSCVYDVVPAWMSVLLVCTCCSQGPEEGTWS